MRWIRSCSETFDKLVFAERAKSDSATWLSMLFLTVFRLPPTLPRKTGGAREWWFCSISEAVKRPSLID